MTNRQTGDEATVRVSRGDVKQAGAHVQAAHVNAEAAVVGLLLVLSDLVQQVEVGPGVFDVFAEVPDCLGPSVLQVVVDPAKQELLGGEGHQVVQSLPVQQEANQA